MERDSLIAATKSSWRRHNETLLALLGRIPEDGLGASPQSRGDRDVTQIFAHLHRVRSGWLYMHDTGKLPKFPSIEKEQRPSRPDLERTLRESGASVVCSLAFKTAAPRIGRPPVE